MTQKRMFSNNVVSSDGFWELPLASQALYFHLGMNADVKGFVSPRGIVRLIGAKPVDLSALIRANLVIPFKSGVVVITHWKKNNTLREDKEAASLYVDEYALLADKDEGCYMLLEQGNDEVREYSRTSTVQLPPSRVESSRVESSRVESSRGEESTLTPKRYTSFKDVDDNLLKEISEDYGLPLEFVRDVHENMGLWMGANNKSYKDYNLALRNWVKRDKAKHMIEAKRLQGRGNPTKGGVYDARSH